MLCHRALPRSGDGVVPVVNAHAVIRRRFVSHWQLKLHDARPSICHHLVADRAAQASKVSLALALMWNQNQVLPVHRADRLQGQVLWIAGADPD
jgi:hypothetical protein